VHFYPATDRPKGTPGTGYCLIQSISFVVCLFVCLFVYFICQQAYEKTVGPICMKGEGKGKREGAELLRDDLISGQFRETAWCRDRNTGRGLLCFTPQFLSFFVSLSARLRENGWTDLHEIFREGVEWPRDLIKFRVNSGKWVGTSKVNLLSLDGSYLSSSVSNVSSVLKLSAISRGHILDTVNVNNPCHKQHCHCIQYVNDDNGDAISCCSVLYVGYRLRKTAGSRMISSLYAALRTTIVCSIFLICLTATGKMGQRAVY